MGGYVLLRGARLAVRSTSIRLWNSGKGTFGGRRGTDPGAGIVIRWRSNLAFAAPGILGI